MVISCPSYQFSFFYPFLQFVHSNPFNSCLLLPRSLQGLAADWLHTGDQHCTCCAFVVDFCCFTCVLARGTQVRATITEGGAEVLKGPNNSLKGPPNEGSNNLLIKLHSLLQGWFTWQQSPTLSQRNTEWTQWVIHIFHFLLKISYICNLVSFKPGLAL